MTITISSLLIAFLFGMVVMILLILLLRSR